MNGPGNWKLQFDVLYGLLIPGDFLESNLKELVSV